MLTKNVDGKHVSPNMFVTKIIRKHDIFIRKTVVVYPLCTTSHQYFIVQNFC